MLTVELYYQPHEGDMMIDSARLWRIDSVLQNGAFLDNVDGWNLRGTNWFVYQRDSDPFLATNDSDSRHESPSVYQNVYELASNREYTLSARVRSAVDGHTVRMAITEMIGDSMIRRSEEAFDVGTEWQAVSVSHRKQSAESRLVVEIYYKSVNPATDIHIDHVIMN